MKIAISAGHNIYNNGIFDRGASNGDFIEATINKETVKILIDLLKKQGHDVLDVTPYNQKFPNTKSHHLLRAQLVNEFKPELFLDIHINAGGGTGVETWVYSKTTSAYPYADKISKSISEHIGLPNRGVKINPTYYSLSLNNYPSIIIEGAFIDNGSDMGKLTPKLYAESVAKVFGSIEFKSEPMNVLYKVQVGAFGVKANADKLLEELKSKGYSPMIVEHIIDKPIVEVPKVEVGTISYEKFGLKIIESNPQDCYVAFMQGKNLRQLGVYGVNGTWQDNGNVKSPLAIWGLVANKYGAIGGNSYQNGVNGIKRGSIVYYQDGTLDVIRVDNLKEITKPIEWVMGGGSLIPNIIDDEKFASDIFRNTQHTGIGYKGGRVYMFVTDTNCTMVEFRNRALKLGLDKAIFVDGGGSSQLNYPNVTGLYSSRGLASGFLVKGVK